MDKSSLVNYCFRDENVSYECMTIIEEVKPQTPQ